MSYTDVTMNRAHLTFISVEARNRTTLHLKVAARRAAGWLTDGPQLVVTNYCKRGRPSIRYTQMMLRLEPFAQQWGLA
jgi:hypothetical protein